jgi:hypothetical protein
MKVRHSQVVVSEPKTAVVELGSLQTGDVFQLVNIAKVGDRITPKEFESYRRGLCGGVVIEHKDKTTCLPIDFSRSDTRCYLSYWDSKNPVVVLRAEMETTAIFE